jgi:hypothetical protein
LAVPEDSTVCDVIARDGYLRETGARSLANAVQLFVAQPLLELYWSTHTLVNEDDNRKSRRRFQAVLAGKSGGEVSLVDEQEADKHVVADAQD